MLLILVIFSGLLSCAFGQCDVGWREYENKCYFFSADVKSWHDALTDCEGKSSSLMSILDIHERTWVRTQIGTEIFWIGLNDIVTEGAWEWTDGSVYYPYLEYWGPGQPDNWADNEDCGQVGGGSNGQWNDESCGIRRRYICKRPNPNPPTTCDTANGWQQFSSNCYKLKADTRRSWGSARHDCVRDGGDLVSIESAEEELYVTGRLDSSAFDLWTGYSTLSCTTVSCEVQADNEQFRWSDASSASYTNWGTGQPDLTDKANGLCSAVIKEADQEYGKWRSHVCRHERPYMCKRGLDTICPPGWLSFSGNCYWVVSNLNLLTSWHEAHTRCSGLGAGLVTIKSEEEQFFINAQLPDLHQSDVPDVWIGISDKDQDGTFQWVDKTAISYSNWNANFPRNTQTIWDCGQIYTGNYNGKWETTNCFKNLGYICKMVGGQNVKPTPAPGRELGCCPPGGSTGPTYRSRGDLFWAVTVLAAGSHCGTGYILFGDHCYHFESESLKDWHAAESYCANDNGHLASYQSQEELSFLSAHMTRSSWLGLNDIELEGTYVWSDGQPVIAELLIWDNNQPDNWQDDEDCMQVRGVDHINPGYLNDQFCTTSFPFICKKGKGEGPPPPPTSGPGWNEKCGTWVSDPFNDYCYLFSYLSVRNWVDARTDCVNQGGDLISITEPFEQSFIQAQVQQIATGVAMWMGGHDSVAEGGWEWTDSSPFRYINWAGGNPDNYYGEDCLSMLINSGYWNDDNCAHRRGYICKRRGNTPVPPPPHDGYITSYTCELSSTALHCPHNSIINIRAAFFGRNSDTICPYEGETSRNCTVEGFLPLVRKTCDNRPFCFLYAHTENDPCPDTSKYLEVVYSCEQNVCVRGLGLEDGNVTDAQLSASSSRSGMGPQKARLNGDSCWMPLTPTNSWIQVDLGEAKKVTGITIQGCPGADHWVTTFKIQSSTNEIEWTDYTEDGGTFPGSVDKTTPEMQLFGTPFSAQYIRVLPLGYNGQVGLRLDILGCKPNYAVSCSAKPSFNAFNDRMTVHCPSGCASQPYSVYGSPTYRGDSTICAAAIHAGIVLNEYGGDCTLLKQPGQSYYPGSRRNGITSKQYNGNFATSYKFADGEMRCSGPDWYEFGEFCYKPSNDMKTWTDARLECQKLGADLVSILSTAEQNWLQSYLYMATRDVWTGLNDMAFQGFFVWSDLHMVHFTYWAPGEPNNHVGFNEDCVEMLHQTGRWNDVPCTELNTYICKQPKAHYPAPSIPPTVYGCPQGWDAYAYACYWMEETPKTRSEAKAFCEERHSKLLHILDIYEQSHFTVKLAGYSGFWWIGLRARGSDSGGVDYLWDNGAPITFTHWDRNQPDSGDGSCVAMTTGPVGGFWDDKACEESFPFVCEGERDGISPPTRAPTPEPVPGCEPGWSAETHFRNCYKFFMMDHSKKKSWNAAGEDCRSRGAELVSIHSPAEELFLSTYSKGKTKWIGLQHNTIDGGYQWSDGSALGYTNWGRGEPNNHQGRENCVEMMSTVNGSSWWNDLYCDAHQDWICEIAKGKKPLIPPVPPPPIPAPECGTNVGWRKHDGTCYYYNDTDVVDFHTAFDRCYAENALPVSITDAAEQAFVNSMVGTGQVSAAWIGLRIAGIAGREYIWLDHSPVTYVHWASGEPNNANGEEQCVQMYRYPGTWNDVNCGRDTAGYVCKKLPGDVHPRPTPTPQWTGNCPEGWKLFGNKCYLFKGDHKNENEFRANWTFAKDWCRTQKGDLVVIDSPYENDFVASYLKDLVMPAWIGLSDIIHEGKFAWIDGSPVKYTNWAEKEPNNNGDQGEHCASMSHSILVTGRWNDDKCHESRGWVCYMKKSSSIPAPPPTTNPCRPGYTSWKNNCYRLSEEQKTWEAAQQACKQDGGGEGEGNLASIDQSYDQSFVSGAVLQGKSDAWIGLRREENGNSYTWTDGWPVYFTHWGPGEPTNHKGEGCVSMHGSVHLHGLWNDTDCSSPKRYICKISSEKPPPTPAPGDGDCGDGWWPFGSYCYFVENGKNEGYSWPESRHYCQEFWGDLVSVHSQAEVDFLRNLNYTKHHNVWLGLTRDRSFGWAWTDMTSLGFVNWAPGEPNEAFHPGDIGSENCVEMYPDGRWNDNNCMQKRGFACRHRQHYTTNKDGPDFPTDGPSGPNGGVIAGAIIGAVVICALLFGLSYYIIKIWMPTRYPKNDVANFDNPTFGGKS